MISWPGKDRTEEGNRVFSLLAVESADGNGLVVTR